MHIKVIEEEEDEQPHPEEKESEVGPSRYGDIGFDTDTKYVSRERRVDLNDYFIASNVASFRT